MKSIRNDRGEDLRKSRLTDFAGAIQWLRDHGVSYSHIRALFPTLSKNNLGVIDFRIRRDPNKKVARHVLEKASYVGASAKTQIDGAARDRTTESNALSDRKLSSASVRRLEDEVEEFAGSFWSHVRFLEGTKALGQFLKRVSIPGSDNVVLVRTGGRINHLLSELHLHAGYSTSAIAYGIEAYRWEQQSCNARPTPSSFETIGKTSLLISHACILRQDFFLASQWLKNAKTAFEVAGITDPEFYRQRAVVAMQTNAPDQAREDFQKSGDFLPDYNSRTTPAVVADARDRFLNFLNDDWEEAFGLMRYAAKNWPAGDIHIGINVNWAAATAYITDSREAHREATNLLLHAKPDLTTGYGHQATVSHLLKLTPQLPAPLRKPWVYFSLYYNAYRNK